MSSWAALIGNYQVALQVSLAAELVLKQAKQEYEDLQARGFERQTARDLAGLDAAQRQATKAGEALALSLAEIKGDPELVSGLKALLKATDREAG